MQVNYCDLCSAPLKENEYFMLYVSTPSSYPIHPNEMEDYYNYLNKVRSGVKEICPSCKHIFDKMFELRLQRLSELTDEINLIFDLHSKSNLKEKNNGKDKK
jgi:hypothetical protein